jgi:hypothetical protein
MLHSWFVSSLSLFGVLLFCLALLDWVGYGLFIQAIWYQ